MNSILINPFRFIAGYKSLAIGVLILLATALVGYFSHTNFPDLISVKSCPGLPLSYIVAQNLSNWLVISIILYLMAIIASPSKIRVVDIFGTQALARLPYLIASFIGFSGSLEKFGNYLMWTALKTGEETTISNTELGIAITLIVFLLLLTIWLVALMYNAFKTSANLKGTKSAFLFIVAFIISTLITIFINKYINQKIF